MTILNQVKKDIKDPQENNYFDIHINRYRHLLNQIKQLNLPVKSKVLDIGVYPPHLFKALKLSGFNTFGIASPHELVKLPQIKTLNIEKTKLPYQEGTFDLVLFTEILEHLTIHPQVIFTQIKKIIKPQGFLILTTPNVLRSQNLFSLLFKRNIYFSLDQLKQLSYHRHNREYTQKELIHLLTSAGFKVVKSHHFISYSPFRQKNQTDPLILKTVKLLNFIFMLIFPSRRDNLYILARKEL